MTSEFIYAKHNPIRSNSVKKSAMQRQSAKETRKNLPIIPSAILQRKFQNCPANANGAPRAIALLGECEISSSSNS